MQKRAYIENYGCQMNQADTELLGGILQDAGYELVASEHDGASVVILNTCSIRERAEERIFGRLGWLKTWKLENPGSQIVVAGCMAQRMKNELLVRAPYVDLVIGPDRYRHLVEHLAEIEGMVKPVIQIGPGGKLMVQGVPQRSHGIVDAELDKTELYDGLNSARPSNVSGFLTIQRGCDKFCTYCIVPFVRGRERSVPLSDVMRQAREMVAQGFVELTLLGQTVSSYKSSEGDLADLLEALHEIEGLKRIRMMSPYPTDFDARLIKAMTLPKVARALHFPLQSGSSTVLERMNRHYDAAQYLEAVRNLRAALPEIGLSTDIIVGFPGETEADFEETLHLLEEIQFDAAFMFRYSERAGTKAARHLGDDIPDAVKGARLEKLIAVQEAISLKRFERMVGQEVEVLVDGVTKRDDECPMGRTSCFKTVVLQSPTPLASGTLVRARITSATSHTLQGTVIL